MWLFQYNLNGLRDKTLYDSGLYSIAIASDYELLVTTRDTKFVPEATEDELILGASASPTAGDAPAGDVYSLYQFSPQLPNYSQGRRKATQLSPVVGKRASFVPSDSYSSTFTLILFHNFI